MNTPPRILIVDDEVEIRGAFQSFLSNQGYEIITASNGLQALTSAKAHEPDLILLDVTMPEMGGIEVCRQLKSDSEFPFTPIIIITALGDPENTVSGLGAGAEEYLTKPVNFAALGARVNSMLRVKALHDTTQEQSQQLAEWNQKLEQRVTEQVSEMERIGRLKQFFSPQIVEVLLATNYQELLTSHRQKITVVFIDLRGFTAFSVTALPEDVMDVLREYQSNMGQLIFQFEGTLDYFAGDGIMVFFNDPQPCPDHELRAVEMAINMRVKMGELVKNWNRSGHTLNFGIGIASGIATLGMTGFEGRHDYTAIGPVVNLAARLSDSADGGQILITREVLDEIGDSTSKEFVGERSFKGFSNPIATYNVTGA